MKTTAIERRAYLLRLYTGLPWQSARRRVEAAAPGSQVIPQPDADQLLLEARVMAALAWRRITTVHPWGIEYVDPRADRLLIRFEADPAERRDQDDTQALDLAEVLLPRADEYGGIKGVPGARIHIEDGQVVLRVVDTSASVTLLGLDPDAWLRAAEVQDQVLGSYGMTPCHQDLPDPVAPGRAPLSAPGPSWHCGVGLDDQRTAAPSRPDPHAGGAAGRNRVARPPWARRWRALGHRPDVRARGHRRLMALLAAPGWGLPLSAWDEHCNCHLPPGYSDQCTTLAAGLAERPGVLEIRAIQRCGDTLKQIQEHDPAIHAAQQQLVLSVPAWVDRWLERGDRLAPDVPVGLFI
ncbi:hypothetical protein [Streptomyces flavofungini]|uniref:hypothetical protein n=1 Tax=Streptomyces flavofungini TaxID=68200 RepID=UPI0025AF8317|nr:hypothetical protein [Streptomyces flavofungini]WJV44103.1 hypothetical protein QUY26_00205 [Streptomyces flavofungini]